ncbi:hypothetical protein ZHAS_00022351 [Anopheles sinensis]|uniref:Uncharacterized protein n=1 Tax=Anopheles sinensis TaxID=74873 RepID=A0A084WUL0_ANOSI|nr:hypothetical protein ZHAS_00022351 [Anopheles sinensis]
MPFPSNGGAVLGASETLEPPRTHTQQSVGKTRYDPRRRLGLVQCVDSIQDA